MQSTVYIFTGVHTGERPFRCDVCDKSCSSSTYLKKHKKNHCSGIPSVGSKRKATDINELDDIITDDVMESKEMCLIAEQPQTETIYVQFENVCEDEEMVCIDPIDGPQQSELSKRINDNDDDDDGDGFIVNDGEFSKDKSLAVCDLLENSADTMLDIDEKQNIYEQIDANTIRIKSMRPIGPVNKQPPSSVLKLSSSSIQS